MENEIRRAEAITKKAAEKRRITLTLTRDQIEQLSKQYGRLNPAEAAELVFRSDDEVTSIFKVAGYSFHADTCCV